jgi:FkbM family methyltransferase
VPLNFDVPKDAVVLDCGAHVGFSALYALQQGASKVICVEPHPVSFKRLEVNLATYVADGCVILHNGAVVTPADHSKPLFITDRGYHSKVGAEGGADTFEVPTKFLLTDLLNPTDGDVPTYVKVDIEGGEIPLLVHSRLGGGLDHG